MRKRRDGTFLRLLGQLKNQKIRLFAVGVCIIVYVILTIYAPYYSADVIDSLLATIRKCVAEKTGFRVPWQLAKDMLTLCVMYI